MAGDATDRSGTGDGDARSGPADHILIRRVLDGDEDAMRLLVDRYDRLIRYTIFKSGRRHCVRDPGWLDARANESWTGIVASLRRAGPHAVPPNIPSYFAQIARNKCLDAAKKADAMHSIPFGGAPDGQVLEQADQAVENPLSMLESIEQLDALQDCISRLPAEDRVICCEIGLIMEKRWREAAQRLGMAESTLRSRWAGVLDRLRACLERKTSKNFAPGDGFADS